jgi:hypothetical protein
LRPETPPPVPDKDLGSSIIVFHSPQAGQRPIHFELSLPQELQNHADFVFAMMQR